MEWNEILSMRKLKEEAYLRIERRRQVIGFMEGNNQLAETLPPVNMSLSSEWESESALSKEKVFGGVSKEDLPEGILQGTSLSKKERSVKHMSQRQTASSKNSKENVGRKRNEVSSPDNRQIGEGRQGAIVDVQSIIADYRLRHPETVPKR